jgi:hypothetical protein
MAKYNIEYIENEECPDGNDNLKNKTTESQWHRRKYKTHLISFIILALFIKLLVQLKSTWYTCRFAGKEQSMLGLHTVKKCGRRRPTVYFIMSVLNWEQAIPNANTKMT